MMSDERNRTDERSGDGGSSVDGERSGTGARGKGAPSDAPGTSGGDAPPGGAVGQGEGAPPDGPATLADEEGLSRELADELRELEELRDRHLRLAAEFENYRRRTRKEITKSREIAQADLAGRLLDALDDLQRVASTPSDATTLEALHEGVQLVERKLRKALSEAGLEAVEARDASFDPAVHEALVTVPTGDPDADDTVSRVFLEGYRFGDRLVRPARVEVRKYDPEAAAARGDDG